MKDSGEVGQPPPTLDSPPRPRSRVRCEDTDPLAKEACSGGWEQEEYCPPPPASLRTLCAHYLCTWWMNAKFACTPLCSMLMCNPCALDLLVGA